ncbi:MAG: S-methyl-5-thioribose-1-phosphate isomerase [Candidatus Hodarchaeales archaeon]|jgi:methylthioribose-1-phosphate isomerase
MKVSFPNGEKKDLKAVWIDHSTLKVFFIDQRTLPGKIDILDSDSVEKTANFIHSMVIRGAPSIGIAGAYGIVQSVVSAYNKNLMKNPNKFYQYLVRDSKTLLQTRPTAIDLENSIDLMLSLWNPKNSNSPPSVNEYIAEAENLEKKLIEECIKIAEAGLTLIRDGNNILTHCHTGSFATVDVGTALSPMKLAVEKGFNIHVYVDETRPRLQGGKLTAWELEQTSVPYTLITDSTAATLMKDKKVNFVIVGADRITANGDVANKIGTYNLSVISKYHDVPFYVAAPWSTFHQELQSGDEIPIEERSIKEVTHLKTNNNQEIPLTFETSSVYNPAFDVTPNHLITGIITPGGILYPPFKKSILETVPKK